LVAGYWQMITDNSSPNMIPFLQLVFAIAVILLAAKLTGSLRIRRQQALRENLPLMPTVVSDLRKPDTGILVVLPVLHAYGLGKET
jgi:hypothetical protein